MVGDALISDVLASQVQTAAQLTPLLENLRAVLAPENAPALARVSLADAYETQQLVDSLYAGYIPATIEGQVVVADGSPAGILIKSRSGASMTFTAADGSFVLRNVPDWAQTLDVQALGGDAVAVPIAGLSGGETLVLAPIHLARGVPLWSPPVGTGSPDPLTTTATLAGRILGYTPPARTAARGLGKLTELEEGLWLTPSGVQLPSAAKPNEHARAEDSVPAPIVEPIAVLVAADGSFEVAGIPSGSGYRLTHVDSEGNGSQVCDIAVQPGERAEVEVARSGPPGSVKLSVQSLASGLKLGGATVRILETGAETTSDADTGAASFARLPPGTYSPGGVPRWLRSAAPHLYRRTPCGAGSGKY